MIIISTLSLRYQERKDEVDHGIVFESLSIPFLERQDEIDVGKILESISFLTQLRVDSDKSVILKSVSSEYKSQMASFIRVN